MGGDASSDDPLDRLAQAARSASELGATTDALLGHFVDRCRHGGCSWSEIGAGLGVSKQAARERFAAMPHSETFEHFTERAEAVLTGARDEARSLGAETIGTETIGTEHLLLALFEPAEALAARVLAELRLGRGAVRAVVAKSKSSSKGATAFAISPAASEALRRAVTEALGLGHDHVGTEHLLRGVLGVPRGQGAQILRGFGVTDEVARAHLLREFARPFDPSR